MANEADEVQDSPDPEANTETPSEDVDENPDAEAAEETPSEEDAEAEEESEPEEDADFLKALEKHKGDKSKFAKHYWETQNQNAEFNSKVKELEQQNKALMEALQTKAPPEPEPEPEPEASPDLDRLDSRIKSYQEKAEAARQALTAMGAQYNDLDAEIRLAKRELSRADDIDKAQIEGQIAALTRQQKQLESTYEIKHDLFESYGERIEDLQEKRSELEEAAERRRLTEQENQKRIEQEQNEYADWVAGSIKQAMKDAGIPDARQRTVDKGVHRALMAHLITHPAKSLTDRQVRQESLGIIQAEVKEFAESLGVTKTKEFKAQSQQKLATARPAKPTARVTTPKGPRKHPLEEAGEGLERGLRARALAS